MKVLFERHTRIGDTIHDQGTVADLPDDEANHQIAVGRASAIGRDQQPPQPDETDQPEKTYRTTVPKAFFRK